MRFLLYNIRYATGSGPGFHIPFPWSGYLKPTAHRLEKIKEFVQAVRPDIAGLLEVDFGSIRTGRRGVNQAEYIAKSLGHGESFACKYHNGSLLHYFPIVRKQGNAFVTGEWIHGERLHYFNKGIKRLTIELELEDLCIFLVHLSLHFHHRRQQLRHLQELVANTSKSVIVAGDFNTYLGRRELAEFQETTGLLSANVKGLPTFPSGRPQLELDFVLHDKSITVTNFEVLKIRHSDHLPIICDFEIGPSRV